MTTPRRTAIFDLLLTGKCQKEIAEVLGMTLHTLRTQAVKVYHENGVTDRIGLMAKFMKRSDVQ